jgi:hypothetical protein
MSQAPIAPLTFNLSINLNISGASIGGIEDPYQAYLLIELLKR